MIDDTIKITAVITTYKREWKYIERAIKSIEAQTYQPIEILIISFDKLINTNIN